MTRGKHNFNVKIFADGAQKEEMIKLAKDPLISGLTTNPTLMKKAGVSDYKKFAHEILAQISNKSISFEVFADEFWEMEKQAKDIASWGSNVYVKIPITNTKGKSSIPMIKRLSDAKVKVNVTAMMTFDQAKSVVDVLNKDIPAYISIFAGRVADAGIDPLPIMKQIVDHVKPYNNIEVIWASPREAFNVIQADQIGCHIITVTNTIIKKLSTFGKDLDEFSLDTVKMFYNDAQQAGFSI